MYFLVLFLYYFVPAQIMLYLYYSCINIEKAAGLYGKAMAESGSKDAFLEIFDRDRNSLLKQGIAAEEIPLMLDIIE